MYLDDKNEWHPEEPASRPARPEITGRQAKTLGWLLAANVVLLIVAPIGGATVLNALSYWMAG